MEQVKQPTQQDVSPEVEAALGALQLSLIRANTYIRHLEKSLKATEAELEGMKAERRATGNVVPIGA